VVANVPDRLREDPRGVDLADVAAEREPVAGEDARPPGVGGATPRSWRPTLANCAASVVLTAKLAARFTSWSQRITSSARAGSIGSSTRPRPTGTRKKTLQGDGVEVGYQLADRRQFVDRRRADGGVDLAPDPGASRSRSPRIPVRAGW
jgi:hypothetical protein